ncbi:hypothetical protein ACS0TY_015895 [Phlomoides rotata]
MGKKKPELQLYNSMAREKQVFKPIVEGKVSMYVCGVTSYDFSHIGHARAYVAFDVLYRYLRYLDYEVVYVRNFTDVDDKIIRRANEVGEDPRALSGRFCQEYLNDMADLQCLIPTHQPRVTDHVDQIKDMIAKIISNGCAYAVDGDVFFSVDNFPNYGKLSGRKLEDNRAGERVVVDTRKRNPFDFALWKSAKPGEPQWDSPWGPGRPGWHIECSAMSAQYLTHKFDIHGGGEDLIFPHHENEIAQSCAACPESNVNYWIHNGFINANGEKMSKSLGNYYTIREVTELYHPLALRHFLLGTHYRSPVNFSITQIEISSEAVFYIYQTLQDCVDALSALRGESEMNSKPARYINGGQECITKLHSDFETRLADDLHTPVILNAALPEAFRFINVTLNMLKKKQQKQQQLSIAKTLIDLEKEIKQVLDVIGLLSNLTYAEVLQQLKDKALRRAGVTEDDVLRSIEERMLARKNKEFSKGDQIRSDLAAKGIALMDVGKETIWRPCVPVQQEKPNVPAQQEKQEKPNVPAQQEKPVIPVEKENPSPTPAEDQSSDK